MEELVSPKGAHSRQLRISLYPKDAAPRVLLQSHGVLDRATRDSPKDEESLHEELAANIRRVHGTEKGTEIVKALGLRIACKD